MACSLAVGARRCVGSRIRDVRWHRMRTEKKLKESEHDTTSVFTSSTIVLSLSEADGGRCGQQVVAKKVLARPDGALYRSVYHNK